MDEFLTISFFTGYALGVISFLAFLWFRYKKHDYAKTNIALYVFLAFVLIVAQDWFLAWLWPKYGWSVNQVCLTAFFVAFICYALSWTLSVIGRVKGGALRLAKYTKRLAILGTLGLFDVFVCFICMFA